MLRAGMPVLDTYQGGPKVAGSKTGGVGRTICTEGDGINADFQPVFDCRWSIRLVRNNCVAPSKSCRRRVRQHHLRLSSRRLSSFV